MAFLTHLVQSALRPVANDVRVLADGDGLRAYLTFGRSADLQRAVRRAVFFSRQIPSYDMIRFFDTQGREVIRINRDGAVVPASQPQDESDRPYVLDALSLSRGQVYISTFDLNVERGKLEVPLKPMLRIATAVFDESGRRRGAYIVNYLGGDLLSQLQEAIPASGHRLRFLNAQGYWIKAAQPAQEWGFIFPERAGLTMAHTNPHLWSRLTSEPSGQTTEGGGIFSWQRIVPSELVSGGAAMVVSRDPFLIVGSEVSAQERADRFAGLQQIFLVVTPGLLFLGICTVLFFRSRQMAIETLRRSEERLSVTLHSIGDAVLATDTQGKITHLNPVAQHLTGWSDSEAKGRLVGDVFKIFNELTREPADIPVEKVVATGKRQELANHTLLVARNGIEHAIADSAAPIRDFQGHILGVVLVFRDVSEERAAAAKLTAALSELDRFFTLSLDFLGILSDDGYFKRVSPAVTDILGWSVEEFLQRPYFEFIHPEDQAATQREVEKQMTTGEKAMHFENRYRHKDGSWRVLSWRSVPQPGGLMYATARDITDLRRTAERIQQLNGELERHTVRLESANKELEAFSYSVSHDLRAPLRHVLGYVEILLRDSKAQLSEKAQRHLNSIAGAGREMGQLIEDLLSFSRMARVEMREKTIDLNLIAEEARRGLESTVADRNILWTIHPMPLARGDAPMIKQVFANLLGNAVKYSRGRDPALIEVGSSGVEDGRLIIFVRDNGAGFEMQYADKLFGVFQRLHRAEDFEGTGIGLANVRRIVSRHGGRTWADGRPDAGATFYFTLIGVQSLNLAGDHPP